MSWGADDRVVSLRALAHPVRLQMLSLLTGAPMSVTPQGSRRNIAVMEAATISAREGGRPVTPL